jgi:hypothetical protein
MNSCRTNRTLIERQQLNFPHVVDSAFTFLKDMGFCVVESRSTIVIFKRGSVLVTLYHGRQSWEIGLQVSKDDETYSLFSILSVAGMPSADLYRNPVATNVPTVISGVRTVAGLLKQYGQPALDGDPVFFERLLQQRIDWSFGIHADQVREKAQTAFRERRYREAAEHYADIEKALTPAELKKLAFALRKSNSED